MLRFFRRIRRMLLKSGRFSQYTVYAVGEILLVMIGILLAIQANNWNENRKTEQLELQMLYEMNIGLREDVKDIIYNIGAHEKILQSQTIVIDWLDSNLPYVDSLAHHFSICNNSTVFVSNEVPYTALKEIGIRTIQNDSLRNKIQTVYDLDFDYYKDHIVMYNDLVFNMWKNINAGFFEATRFKFSNPNNTMPPLDPKAIKGNNIYTYSLKTAAEFNSFYITKIMKRARDRGKELISMIDQELNNRGYNEE